MDSLYLIKEIINIPEKSIPITDFNIIELITLIAALSLLASIERSTLQSVFSNLENDKAQAHLNPLTGDCIKTHENTGSNNVIPSPTSADTNLLGKNDYKDNRAKVINSSRSIPKTVIPELISQWDLGFPIAWLQNS